MNSDYKAALEVVRAATREFMKAQKAFRAREISASAFVEAKAVYERASAVFDAAYAKEESANG